MKKRLNWTINVFVAFFLLTALPSIGAQKNDPEKPQGIIQRLSNLPTWKKVVFGACVACVIGGGGIGTAATINIYLLKPKQPTQNADTFQIIIRGYESTSAKYKADAHPDNEDEVFAKEVLPQTGLKVAKDKNGDLAWSTDVQTMPRCSDLFICSWERAGNNKVKRHHIVTLNSKNAAVIKAAAKIIQEIAQKQQNTTTQAGSIK